MKSVLIIDGNNYAHRGFWAIKEELMNRDGIPTNAVRGFFNILGADIRNLKPTHLAVSFDRTPSYRRLALYPEYKGTRVHDPNITVTPQIQIIRRLLRASGIPTLGVIGEESDDIIATLCGQFSRLPAFEDILISSTDKDFAQLVTDKVKIVESRTRSLLGPKGIKEKFGVGPRQIRDYLTLIGDKVDNVPGCPGVAAKTAVKLLTAYKNIKGVIRAAAGGQLTPKLSDNLVEFERSGQLALSYELIGLYAKVKIRFEEKRFDIGSRTWDDHRVSSICDELGMKATHEVLRGINK